MYSYGTETILLLSAKAWQRLRQLDTIWRIIDISPELNRDLSTSTHVKRNLDEGQHLYVQRHKR